MKNYQTPRLVAIDSVLPELVFASATPGFDNVDNYDDTYYGEVNGGIYNCYFHTESGANKDYYVEHWGSYAPDKITDDGKEWDRVHDPYWENVHCWH